MSFIPTEKIFSPIKEEYPPNMSPINRNNYYTSNINAKYTSSFPTIPQNLNSVFSPKTKQIYPPLNNIDNKMIYYLKNQYKPYPIVNKLNYYDYQNINNIIMSPRLQTFPMINNENIQNKIYINNIDNKNRENNDAISRKNINLNNDKINMNINMNVNNNIYHFSLGENNINEEKTNYIQEERKKKKFFCNCKKSECLKLYCDCFANGEKCIGCNCKNCSNQIGNELFIKKIYDEVVERNPISIKLNLQKEARTNGCNCRKSSCLKKYCECYKAGLLCTSSCRCSVCDNSEKKENTNNEKVGIIRDKKDNIGGQLNQDSTFNNSEERGSKIITDENNVNINIKINNINSQIENKFNYKKYSFEKISVLINNNNIHIQIYKYLKSLDIDNELNNNIIFLSNIEQDIVNIPKKKLNLEAINKSIPQKINIKNSYLNKKKKRQDKDEI